MIIKPVSLFSKASPGLTVRFFFFAGERRGFLKEGVKIDLKAPMSPLESPTFFPSAHQWFLTCTDALGRHLCILGFNTKCGRHPYHRYER
jgi:hypothetical protein